jgi:alpha,alpha-trehalose phosphorylase
VGKTGLQLSEVKEWRRAADGMYVAYDETLGIHLQDDEFLDKKPWDFANTPPEKYPLLLHHHPLVIYRHQVIKQADVILAMFLLGNEFSAEQKKRNFDFYDPLTTGDSSLSVSIQAIIAFELAYLETARRYFTSSCLMDLADVAGNAADGCHIASMGGTWMAGVYGFAGMRDYNGRISFDPTSPGQLERVRFPVTVRDQMLEVDIRKDGVTYSLREGKGLTIRHRGREVTVKPGEPITMGHRANEAQEPPGETN